VTGPLADPRRVLRSIIALTVVLVAVLGATASAVGAQAPAQQRSQDELRQQLAERFAPIMMLKQQEEACSTDGEQYRPGSIDIVLDNPEIALRQVGRSDPVVKRAPSAADLFGLGEGFFLDFPGNSLTPGCIYERDFRKYTGDRPATIYAHVVRQPDEPDLVFVQYWFYWYYNDWNNKHESDWEGITLKFEASSVQEALETQPVAVGFSQHEGGERADWDDSKLEREGDRPIVYSSAGSHASYYGSAPYLGRAASEGFGCDDTTGPSERLDPEVVLLPDSVTDPNDPLAWLGFNGRWGERQEGPFNGPTGPNVKDRWLEPAPWFDELRSSSVVIPTGDSQAASVIAVFCAVVEGGSKTLVDLSVSPVQVAVTLIIAAWSISFLVKRTDWSLVAATPIRQRRRAGQIIRAAAAVYRSGPLVFVLFGLVYIPAAIVSGTLAWLVEFIPLVGGLLSLSGSGAANLLVALLVGSGANLAAFMVVNSMVADHLRTGQRGLDTAKASMQQTWQRRAALGSGFVRSYLIVAVLLASVIGIPWGIRQLVRYQFIAQAVTLEDRTGPASLTRSTELVRGRWLHTAIVSIALTGMVVVSGTVVGVVLLVLVSGIPLWLFSGLVSIVYAVLVPLAAIALTLLYGDAAEEHDATQLDEPVAVA